MQIADRLLKTPPYPFAELARLKREAQAQGIDLIDFGIGDPDLPTPDHIVQALREAALDPATHHYDETVIGLPALREAVADWYSHRFQVDLDPDREVLRLGGSKDGVAHLPWAVLNPGDICLVPDPGYPVYSTAASFAGAQPYYLPLRPENGYLPDLDAVPPDVARRAKLIYLNYPNMPTGAVAERGFYQIAVEFARRHGMLVALDMAYSEIGFDGYRPQSILQVPGAKEVALELHSFSKTYSMTGWRIGFAVGNAQALAALAKLKTNLDSGVFLAVQRAGVTALRSSQECVEQMRRIYQRRRDMLVDGLRSLGWAVEKPKAAFFVWAPAPGGTSSADFAAQLLSRARILLTPGNVYGEQGEGFVRMALTIQGGNPEARITEAIGQMREAGFQSPAAVS